MRLPWGRKARPIKPLHGTNIMRAELETAKEILAEVFKVGPSEVEDMIHGRLEERSLTIEQKSLSEDALWPATFCLGEE